MKEESCIAGTNDRVEIKSFRMAKSIQDRSCRSFAFTRFTLFALFPPSQKGRERSENKATASVNAYFKLRRLIEYAICQTEAKFRKSASGAAIVASLVHEK